MKKTVLYVLLLHFACSLSAETVKGRVTDGNGAPMQFVTISVMDKDSVLLTGAITDDDGRYAIEDLGLQMVAKKLLKRCLERR